MNKQTQVSTGEPRQRHRFAWGMVVVLILVMLAVPLALPARSQTGEAAPQLTSQTTAPAATNTLHLQVVSARDEPLAFDGAGVDQGDPVTTYKFLINVDNTGDPTQPEFPDCYPFLDPPNNTVRNPNYPANCDWPGIRTVPGAAPVYTLGDQDDLNGVMGIDLPPGKYLISVIADGFKIDGEHFTVPLADSGLVQVAMQPLPLPPATMVIKVFDDKSMTNGAFDAPVEQGLAGFRASLNDTMGEITADLFGNPLCTEYAKDVDGNVILNPDGTPVILTLGNGCYSDANGDITIPNIGPLRYDVLVIPPDGQDWIQTSTLEGSQGWDTWLQEAGTGLDNEFVVGGEPFPWTLFGFVSPTPALAPSPDAGSIKGVIVGVQMYVPLVGGLPYQGGIWGGLSGAKIDRPIANCWISLADLQNGDTAIWVGQGNADGSFEIPNVPPGNYSFTYWDENQHYILDWVQVTVQPNQETDMGVKFLTGWFTEYYGSVFYDNNENGKRDPDEAGVPDYLVVLRDRDNTEIDRMSISALTDENGNYILEKAYPMGSWMVLEAYNDLYRTTGITFQASNQPEETTILGAGVDVGVLPMLGQSGRLDWGVKFYEPDTNGGIVGTVSYDTMRAEDNARYAGAEPYQPGIPGLTMNLYATVKDIDGNFVFEADGAYKKGPLLNTTETETYVRPQDCQARDVDGNPIDFPALPPATGGHDCLEGPVMGVQFGTEFAELDGNYGFGEILADPVTGAPLPAPLPIPPGDYLVEVVIPPDPILGHPLYRVTREEDLNMFAGNTFVPQIPPPACAGPLHTVLVTDTFPAPPGYTYNPGYIEAGGSRYEGQNMPLCNVKLVTLSDRRSIAPLFMLFTDVPIPGRWKGYIIDDLNIGTDPLALFYGEKPGLQHMPIGIYDYTGRLVHTTESDRHGVFEVILPSDDTFNAPTPSGILANVYYLFGNDPGTIDHPNLNYNPQYRSIGASFEMYPGVMVPADLAPVQNGVTILAPGSQVNEPAQCQLSGDTPQLFAVSQPYASSLPFTLTIRGKGFGATQGYGRVTLGTTELAVSTWSENQIEATVPATVAPGAYQLLITGDSGKSTVNGLTFHVLGTGYNPTLFEVSPTGAYTTIQSAVDAAALVPESLVVVYPGAPVAFTNPMGYYYENPILYSPVKLQGVGPGGIYTTATDAVYVPGALIDGRSVGGDSPYTDIWRTLLGDIWLNRGGWSGSPTDGDGNPIIAEGATLMVLANNGEFTAGYPTTIDGFTIQGGDQQGFPNNINQTGGGRIPGVAANVVVQGGGVFVNAYAQQMRITNNIIRGNGGAYGGAIRIGTPDRAGAFKDSHNDNVVITHNRILANGGTNLAGAIGVFAGADGYEIADNDLCGNFSAEYGGGISHYGYSPAGQIHNNRIYFNRSYDEGGGIMIAGELPADFTQLSPGAGPVDIYANLIQANLSNDDGGGIRFLMAGNYQSNVYNNMVVNNVSTHEGGGISLNDAPDVRVYNNTIMKNLTTATAMTSNGLAAPTGLSTARNSDLLQATLPGGAPIFSNPLLFNNLFWDNRAGSWDGTGVSGIGITGDPAPIYNWDLGVADNSGVLSPTYSILQVPYGTPNVSNQVGADPQVIMQYDTTVSALPWRGNPNLVGVDIIAVDLPPDLMGNYHLLGISPARNTGTDAKNGIAAPTDDIDGDPRPLEIYFDIGADEFVVYKSYLPLVFKSSFFFGP
ncbi:MAG: IPT/TIG domain-containing protein [Chloroflexi bacterium]|nr:IPT/TIG domain-containing protein [Chloroflexota bacterium]